MGMDDFFGCGKSVNCLRDFPSINDKERDGSKGPPSDSG